MKLLHTVGFAALAHAVNLKYYVPGPLVEPGIKAYLKELYVQFENPATTTTFTNLFTTSPPGQFIVLSNTATGPQQILALKESLNPPDGSVDFNHYPNLVTVHSDNSTAKAYDVQGVLDTTIRGVNCSASVYSVRFTVQKGKGGTLNLTPDTSNLLLFDDLVIQPFPPPTPIPCEV